ncbi:MAG: V-type ATP synthase subunit F [Clostridia bacterium]|nr:V-type ATP synthase subunit F [Clostridia bacterium]
MYKIAAMGDKDSIYGFASLGISIFPVEDSADAGRLLRQLAESEYGVIYITEALASDLNAEIQHYASKPLPAIIPVPGIRGNTGIGLENVSKFVEKAVGSDIIS